MFPEMKDTRTCELHLWSDEQTGLQAVVAIHDTRRGPALGGCRFHTYISTDAAIEDAVRLARGMSYKAALAGLAQGGGKAVMIVPRELKDRTALFQAFGRFVHSLNGRYITAMDMGTTTGDMDAIAQVTPHVTCTSRFGNPAPYTALGVFHGIKATLQACGDLPNDLSKARIAVQGLGHVGYALCEKLHAAGAQLVVSDIDAQRAQVCEQQFGAEVVSPQLIQNTECDVFSPCGMGGVLMPESILTMQCRAVAGSANNQLATPEAGLALHRQGILYAPDYLANAGGLIYASLTHNGKPAQEIHTRIQAIEGTLLKLFQRNKTSGEPTSLIAERMAEDVLYGASERILKHKLSA